MVAAPIFWALEFIHKLVGNWGWSIVLLTVAIKAAFFPLSAASYKSMAKMRVMTPRLMALKERYADVFTGDERWRSLPTPEGNTFEWDDASTYVRKGPYFDGMPETPAPVTDIDGAF